MALRSVPQPVAISSHAQLPPRPRAVRTHPVWLPAQQVVPLRGTSIPATPVRSTRARSGPPPHSAGGRHGAMTPTVPLAQTEPTGLLLQSDMADMPVAFTAGGGPSRARRILCYGDSLTAGFCHGGHRFEPYARALAEQLGGANTACEVAVCGHSGRTAEEMVASAEGSLVDIAGLKGKGLARALREDGPFDLVLIMAGTNDMGYGAEQEAILRDVRRLHALCHARGTPTVALAPPPMPRGGTAREARRLRIVEQLRAMCQQAPAVAACVDPAELVPAGHVELWDRDGLHFAPAGSRALGRGLARLALELAAPSCRSPPRPEARPLLKRQAAPLVAPAASRRRQVHACAHAAPAVPGAVRILISL